LLKKCLYLTRTIKVSCSAQFLKLAAVQINTAKRCTRIPAAAHHLIPAP
jgi:hypothetical protein